MTDTVHPPHEINHFPVVHSIPLRDLPGLLPHRHIVLCYREDHSEPWAVWHVAVQPELGWVATNANYLADYASAVRRLNERAADWGVRDSAGRTATGTDTAIILPLVPHRSGEPDAWHSPDGVVLRCHSRHLGYATHFRISYTGPAGHTRREHSGPLRPGPYAYLVTQLVVISARPQTRPLVVTARAGDTIELWCLDTNIRHPGIVGRQRVRIVDPARTPTGPRLEPVQD